MENIINRIIEIDESAKKKMEDTLKKKQQISIDTQAEAELIKEANEKKIVERIEVIDKEEQKISNDLIETLQSNKEKEISNLRNIYDSQHSIIEKDIVSRIVGDI